jgi:hypothetical protein
MKIFAIVLGLLLVVAGAWSHGNYHGHKIERLLWVDAQAVAVQEALDIERERQRGVNDALQIQADRLADINTALSADLDRLRDRPAVRVRTIIYPGATCKGTTGADLSGPDASFLVREAARADTIRAGLIGCYAAYDALSR